MKGRPVDQLVWETMFPKPRQQDPYNFQTLLQRHLVLEVRQEVHSFYGHLDTPEAKYPGLDYTHPIHRIRLSRWPWHRRLFRAFDALGLTHSEIMGLTKWEGTKWAKERFEREQGIVIRDTAADGFTDFVEPENRNLPESQHDGANETGEGRSRAAGACPNEDSEGELESVGVALNERLRERVALRLLSGDNTVPVDEEWENWFKNALESGLIDEYIAQLTTSSGTRTGLTADDLFPPEVVTAARAGQWDQVPEFLRELVRQALDSERRAIRARRLRNPPPSADGAVGMPSSYMDRRRFMAPMEYAHMRRAAEREERRNNTTAAAVEPNA